MAGADISHRNEKRQILTDNHFQGLKSMMRADRSSKILGKSRAESRFLKADLQRFVRFDCATHKSLFVYHAARCSRTVQTTKTRAQAVPPKNQNSNENKRKRRELFVFMFHNIRVLFFRVGGKIVARKLPLNYASFTILYFSNFTLLNFMFSYAISIPFAVYSLGASALPI